MKFAVNAWALATMSVVLSAPVATSSEPRGRTSGTRVVEAKDFSFKPGGITVRKGTTVRWRFLDSTAHNVVSRGKHRFRSSGTKRRGGTHRVRFRRAGRYSYVCTFHRLTMEGVVVVR